LRTCTIYVHTSSPDTQSVVATQAARAQRHTMSDIPGCDLWDGLESTDASHLISAAAQQIVKDHESGITACRQQEQDLLCQVQQLQADHQRHMHQFVQQMEERFHVERAALQQEHENQVSNVGATVLTSMGLRPPVVRHDLLQACSACSLRPQVLLIKCTSAQVNTLCKRLKDTVAREHAMGQAAILDRVRKLQHGLAQQCNAPHQQAAGARAFGRQLSARSRVPRQPSRLAHAASNREFILASVPGSDILRALPPSRARRVSATQEASASAEGTPMPQSPGEMHSKRPPCTDD
jgi:hypothetical protein